MLFFGCMGTYIRVPSQMIQHQTKDNVYSSLLDRLKLKTMTVAGQKTDVHACAGKRDRWTSRHIHNYIYMINILRHFTAFISLFFFFFFFVECIIYDLGICWFSSVLVGKATEISFFLSPTWPRMDTHLVSLVNEVSLYYIYLSWPELEFFFESVRLFFY